MSAYMSVCVQVQTYIHAAVEQEPERVRAYMSACMYEPVHARVQSRQVLHSFQTKKKLALPRTLLTYTRRELSLARTRELVLMSWRTHI